MGFFNRGGGPPARGSADDDFSAEYLQSAPPGPRTNNLAAACALRIGEMPLAEGVRYGEPLTVAALAPVGQRVREIMEQDRDLSAWIARKAMVLFMSMLEAGMDGDAGQKLDVAWAAGGLEISSEVRLRPSAGNDLPTTERDGAVGLASAALHVLLIVTTPPPQWPPNERRFYTDLYTGASGEDVEDLAYMLIAWTCTTLGRLRNSGRLRENRRLLPPEQRDVPRLHRAGWYPNPPRHGDASSGTPQFQRYWDGQWSDRVRVREGRGFREGRISLHAPPTD